MKTLAKKIKPSPSNTHSASSYVHHPVNSEQKAQQNIMRQILHPELVQTKLDSKQEEEEEPAQAKLIQRQPDNEEEEPVQAKLIQRQPDNKEEEEPVQAKLIQRQSDNEKEEPVQARLIQRQPDNKEEEEPVQAKLIQRQPDNEEEEPVQARLIQRQFTSLGAKRISRFGYVGAKQKQQQTEVQSILRTSSSQAKLTLGQPNDKYEQEADRVADQVTASPDPRLQRQTENNEEETVQTKPLAAQITPVVQRQQEPEEEEPVQAKAEESGSLSVGFQEQLSSKGSGHPLSESTRASMEPHFGTDLSDVRVHTDSSSVRMNKEVGAQAFTHGSDIYFNEGKYNPDSTGGKHLLAHELTHTIQQGAVVRKSQLPISSTSPKIQRLSLKGILNKVANYIPGYSLITVILGKNPITGEPVPRTGKNILKGVLGLIPIFGNIWFNNLQKTGAADKAGLWLDKQIEKLNITWSGIKALISQAWDEMSIWKGISGNIKVMKKVFGPVWGRVKAFLSAIGGKIKEFILDGALALAGSAGKQVKGIMNKGKKIFMKILDDPLGFVKNFLKAVGLGFSQFGRNFIKHLKGALFGWMFGAFAKAGIELPKSFDIKSIFGFILQIFGLTYTNIRAKLVKKLGSRGEKVVSVIEKSVGFVKELITKGPIALWAKIKESLSNLKTMIFDQVKSWLITTIIKKAMFKLATMFNPVGALIQAAIAIYNTVMFFIERWNQIKEVVSAIFGAIGPIAFGQLGKAANFVETMLGKGLTLVISFLARFIGLGGIVDKIKNIINKIRKPIDKALNKVIGWLVKKGKALLAKMKLTAKKVKAKVKDATGKLVSWWKAKKKFKSKDGSQHSIFFKSKKNPKITVKSTETGLESIIKVMENPSSLGKDKAALKQALLSDVTLTTKTTNLKNVNTQLNSFFAKASTRDPAKTGEQTDAKKIEDFLVTAKNNIPSYFLDSPSDANLPLTNVTWKMEDGKAHKVVAEPLSKRAGNTKGQDAPGSPIAKGFELAQWIHDESPRTHKGFKPIIYHQTHLLSETLHGPAVNWNLTPTTHKVNTGSMKSTEKAAKAILNETPSRVLRYETTAKYELANATYGTLYPHHNLPDHLKNISTKDFPSSIEVTTQERVPKKGGGDEYKDTGGLPALSPVSMDAPVLPGVVSEINLLTMSRADLKRFFVGGAGLLSVIQTERITAALSSMGGAPTEADFIDFYSTQTNNKFSKKDPEDQAKADFAVFNGLVGEQQTNEGTRTFKWGAG